MTELLECPADDCDYRGVKSSILGHYSGKRDKAHEGGYAEAKNLLGDVDKATESRTEPDTESAESPEPPEPEPRTPETKAEPLPEMPSEPEQKDPEPDDPEMTCPGCGSTEIADAQLVVRNQGERLSNEHTELLDDSDYVCSSCGGVFDE